MWRLGVKQWLCYWFLVVWRLCAQETVVVLLIPGCVGIKQWFCYWFLAVWRLCGHETVVVLLISVCEGCVGRKQLCYWFLVVKVVWAGNRCVIDPWLCGPETVVALCSPSGQLKIPSHLSKLHVEQEVTGDETQALQSVLDCDEKRQGLLRLEQELNQQISSSATK